MLGTVLLFGVLAGADNLQVCSVVGLLPIEPRRRHLLAAAFSFCEMAAPLLGLVLGHLLLRLFAASAPKAGPVLMLLAGGAVLLSALAERGAGWQQASRIPNSSTSPRLLFGLPLSLSVDNLLGGAGISALGYPMVPAALLIGLVSAAMSCAGLYFGGWLRRIFRRRFAQFRFTQWSLEPAVGAYLCLLGLRMLIASRS